jgi:hypothetical protein
MIEASGTFEIEGWDEQAVHDRAGEVKLTRVSGVQRFTGDIEGDGTVEWLMCYAPDGTARFVGLQRIEGSIGARRGSFVVESSGDHDGASSKGTWTVIAGSGAGDLAGISGEGGFDAPGGMTVSYHLAVELA